MRRLLVLLRTLPVDAYSRREDPTDVFWGIDQELLAQTLEMVSILAAEKRIKEPRQVPRPGQQRAQKSAPVNTSQGLASATIAMAQWAERNGGAGGDAKYLLTADGPARIKSLGGL